MFIKVLLGLLISTSILINSNNAFANPEPSVNFDGNLGKIDKYNPNTYSYLSKADYLRMIGKRNNEIYSKYPNVKKDEKIKFKDHTFLSFKSNLDKEPYLIKQGTYILNSSDICVGYLLIQDFSVEEFLDQTILNTIESLAKNNSLKGKFQIPSNIQIIVYQRDAGNFIERYVVAKTRFEKLLLLDAFYPKELDNTFEALIISTLSNNFNIISIKDQVLSP